MEFPSYKVSPTKYSVPRALGLAFWEHVRWWDCGQAFFSSRSVRDWRRVFPTNSSSISGPFASQSASGWRSAKGRTRGLTISARLVAGGRRPFLTTGIIRHIAIQWLSRRSCSGTGRGSKGPFTHAIFHAISMRFWCDFACETCLSLPCTGF